MIIYLNNANSNNLKTEKPYQHTSVLDMPLFKLFETTIIAVHTLKQRASQSQIHASKVLVTGFGWTIISWYWYEEEYVYQK